MRAQVPARMSWGESSPGYRLPLFDDSVLPIELMLHVNKT